MYIFLFINNWIYGKNDGVETGSLISPVLANIFICELETNLVSKLSKISSFRERLIDESICSTKSESSEYALNSFQNNM